MYYANIMVVQYWTAAVSGILPKEHCGSIVLVLVVILRLLLLSERYSQLRLKQNPEYLMHHCLVLQLSGFQYIILDLAPCF